MSSIRFRFTFNRTGSAGGSRRGVRKAVNAVVENVAFKYADGTLEQVKGQLDHQIKKDVAMEVSYMAGLMKQHIIGIGAGNHGPSGRITMAHEMAGVSSLLGIESSYKADTGIKWSDRSQRYMGWKRRRGYGQTWFKNRGVILGSVLGQRQTWLGRYGPIEVRVSKGDDSVQSSSNLGTLSNRSRDVSAYGRVTYADREDSHIQKRVCTILVAALGNITPRMLPALSSGTLGAYPDSRKTGLLDFLPREARLRLAGPKSKPYRHTIEPFLSFMLTRAIPNALFLRVEKGLRTKLIPENVRLR